MMKTKSNILLSAALGALTLTAATSASAAETWAIDASHSSVGFAVSHLVVSKTKGTFGKFEGSVTLDPKNFSKSTVEVSIDAASIDTNDEKRDGHLKSADFFDVEKFPKLTFKSTKVKAAGKGKLAVTGDLTIHGVTKSVTLNVEGPTPAVKDPWGNMRRGLSASTKIKRSDFGLTWNKALEAGGVVVGEEVTINLEVELIKK